MRTVYPILPGGLTKVVTLSFDDGRLEDRKLVSLLNRYKLRATFHLNSGLAGANRIPLDEIASLYQNHEIACHGVTHSALNSIPFPLVVQQILEDRRTLERLTERIVRGFSYPYGEYTPDIAAMLPALGIRYARTTQRTGRFAFPASYLEWDATCHLKDGLLSLADDFLTRKSPRKPMLFFAWGHSYELSEPGGWELMEVFCKRMAEHEDIWYATNIEICDYMTAVARMEFATESDRAYNPSAIDCWVNIDGNVCRIPGGEEVVLL